MLEHPITAAVATLVVADPAACDRVGLGELVAVAQRVRGWLDAFDATVAAAADRLAAAGSAEPAAEVLTDGGRRSSRDARAAAERGAVCASMPAVGDALATGVVSAGHVDAIARASRDLDPSHRDALAAHESELVAAASTTSVEAFTRHVRDLTRQLSADDGLRHHERLRQQRCLRRWVDHHTGLAHTHLALDPESDARLSAALDAAVTTERHTDEDRTFDQVRADAFITLATGARHHGRRPAELSVLIDHATLHHGFHPPLGLRDPRRVAAPPRHRAPPRLRRRHHPHRPRQPRRRPRRRPHPPHRHRRPTPRPRAMYRTCAHPHCSVRFADCDIHHVTAWTRQRGPTNLANLLPLCDRHHHLVHEGHWHLTLHPDRTITLQRPDGTTTFHDTTIDVAPTGTHHDPTHPDHPADAGSDTDTGPDTDTDTDDEIAVMTALTRARLRTLRPPPTHAA